MKIYVQKESWDQFYTSFAGRYDYFYEEVRPMVGNIINIILIKKNDYLFGNPQEFKYFTKAIRFGLLNEN